MTKEQIQQVLRAVIDPEVGLNIVDLGLIYGIEIVDGEVQVHMTMTTPACPLGSYIRNAVETAVTGAFPEVSSVKVSFVWDPPWRPEMISDDARRLLGWQP